MTAVLLTRPAGAGVQTLDEYDAEGGYEALRKAVQHLTPADVLGLVRDAELRGRGGAAFPTGRKWELAASSAQTPRYVVANGGEHEPGSRKDRLLVAEYPHKVLEGTALCAFATGASVAYLYLIEDMVEALESARRAIADAHAAGLLGPPILGSSFSLEIRLATAPTSYVAGEETAAPEV